MRLILILAAAMFLGCSNPDHDPIEHDRAVFRRAVNEIRLIGRTIKGEQYTNIGRIVTNLCISGDISHETHKAFEDGTKWRE